ncbi:MAG TPA: segregation/condensation protein A [Longimicrobiales bacterium]
MEASVAAGEDAFIVELDRFHGPLDLLLHLIREQDIDIFDIPIARITEQFLRAIEGVERLGLDRAGDFLEMAAMLIRIKVRMLLPRRGDEEEEAEDPRAELVRRLLEYEHFREIAQHLEAAERDRLRHAGRGYVPPRPEPAAADAELELVWEDVWAAVLAFAERTRPPAEHRVTPRLVPIEEKIALILDTLAQFARIELHRLVAPYGDRLHTVVTLMASLELARRRALAIRQSEPFAAVWLYRRNGIAANAEGDADR